MANIKYINWKCQHIFCHVNSHWKLRNFAGKVIDIYFQKKQILKVITTCCGCLDNTVLSDISLTSSECHVIVCQATIVAASVWLDRYVSCDSANANPDTRLLSPEHNMKAVVFFLFLLNLQIHSFWFLFMANVIRSPKTRLLVASQKVFIHGPKLKEKLSYHVDQRPDEFLIRLTKHLQCVHKLQVSNLLTELLLKTTATMTYGLITLAYSRTGTGTSTIGNNRFRSLCNVKHSSLYHTPFFLVPVPVSRRQTVWIHL